MLVGLCVLVAFSAPAAATSPVPPIAEGVQLDSFDYAVIKGGITEKHTGIQERCLPRNLVCVGPYDPDPHLVWGDTGVRLIANDTNATAGHDPYRHWEFGPYVAPGVVDDVRVCWSKCKVPMTIYGGARVNVTLMVYVLGRDPIVYSINTEHDLSPTQPGAIPSTWGCQYATHWQCPP